jgi:murein DD-endopeptidase MepM/ murein hydrolase activator NlpD
MPKVRGLQAGEQGNYKRVSGDISDGLYWSLRSAGASPELAADYLKAIATHADVGEVAPFDRFDFIVAKDTGALVYAALDRAQASDVQLIRWTAGGRTGWFDAGASVAPAATGLMAPVAGRITSGFGYRYHPILRFSRLHAGIDFGARWGSPIVAAADGMVIAAGYAGGYGRQVRIAHGSGIVTSYSHMSATAATPGVPVRQGQVIGYVGSSGLSTGPHLHFEVRVGGQPVNPLTARLVGRPQVDQAQVAQFKTRLKQMQAIPLKPVASGGKAL